MNEQMNEEMRDERVLFVDGDSVGGPSEASTGEQQLVLEALAVCSVATSYALMQVPKHTNTR